MANWVIAKDDISIEQELAGVPVSVLKIIKRRGIAEENFEDFLSDRPKNTYDPFLIPDLREGCEALLKAAADGKKICVYGDYDADGITSTTLMLSLIKHFTDNVFFYIPSRFLDGYGPNKNAIKKIADAGASFLITVDCGITSAPEIEYAKSLGMECVVTDHHILREGMTPSCLCINPHRADSSYPYRELSGCGVAFKFAQGIQRICENAGQGEKFTKKELNSFLDIVAISTVADIVPLQDENRNLVKYGLDIINRRQRKGLATLLDVLSLEGPVDAGNISYVIAPNLNALGRMATANSGVDLLMSEKDNRRLLALALNTRDTNVRRKAVQEETINICKNAMQKENCGDYALVINAPGAHEGVAGIVAGNLKEEYNRPVCIVAPSEDGSLKGSARSIPGINLHALFEKCTECFERFGGHAGACGFTLKQGMLEAFRDKMQLLVKEELEKNPELFDKTIYIEKELDPCEKTLDFATAVARLAPFGEANPVPLFCIRNVVASDIRTMGSEGQHIKFVATGDDGIKISCISFGGSEKYKSIIKSSQRLDVAGELEINSFRGRDSLQIKIADVKANRI